MPARTRPILLEDAVDFARLLDLNRAFMAPWDAIRPDVFYTEAGQQTELRLLLQRAEQGHAAAHVILDDEGAIAGGIRLNGIVRGAFQSCSLGYWVDQDRNGRGLAGAAVAAMLDLAFGELGLHRVQAETLLGNVRSQRVLAKNGFTHIGTAPDYIEIAGRWRDHALFQRLAPAPSADPAIW